MASMAAENKSSTVQKKKIKLADTPNISLFKNVFIQSVAKGEHEVGNRRGDGRFLLNREDVITKTAYLSGNNQSAHHPSCIQ